MNMTSELVKGLRKLANQWKHNDVAGYNLIFDACDTIEALSAKVRAEDRPNNKVHLCNSCQHNYPDCSAEQNDVIFGDGTGNDNICCCAKYEAADRPTGKWVFDEFGHFFCSECGGMPNDQTATTDYCPYCGAEMGGK